MFQKRALLFVIGLCLLGCASLDRASGIAVVQTGHSRSITSVAFSPDGRLAVSGSDDSTLKLWEVFTGREVRTFQGITANVTAVAFSPDGSLVLSGHNDGTLAFWEVSTGQKIRKIEGHATWIHSVAFSPDGALLATGGGFHDPALRFRYTATWNLVGKPQPWRPASPSRPMVGFSPPPITKT